MVFPGEGDLRIRDAGGHIVDYSDYNTRYNDNVKEYILAAVSDYLDDIYKDLGRTRYGSTLNSPHLGANNSTTEQQEKFKKTLDKLRNLWYNEYVLKERTKLNTERLLPKV